MIRRPPRSTPSNSSAASDVYKRQLEQCPKYRHNMFKKLENKNLCEQILREVAERHKLNITELSVMPDYIHMVASIPPTMSVSKAFPLLKGASAHALSKETTISKTISQRTSLESLKILQECVGDADLETVVRYVQDQRLIQTTLDDKLVGC